MAKKKTHHRKPAKHRGGRRMGAVHVNAKTIWDEVLSSAGFVIAHIGGGMMQRTEMAMKYPKAFGVAQAVGGIYVKHKFRNPFMEGVGWGFQGAGSLGVAQDLHVIKGIDDFMNGIDGEMNGGGSEYNRLDEGRQNGIENSYMLNGMENLQSLGAVC